MASSRPADRPPQRRRRVAHPWNPLPPLFVGLCFGLAFAGTSRLLDGRFASFVRLGERFEVKGFPGTGLESLRMRFGAERIDLHGSPERSGSAETKPNSSGNPSLDPLASPMIKKESQLEKPLTDPLEALNQASPDPKSPLAPRAPQPPQLPPPVAPVVPPPPAGSATVVAPPVPWR